MQLIEGLCEKDFVVVKRVSTYVTFDQVLLSLGWGVGLTVGSGADWLRSAECDNQLTAYCCLSHNPLILDNLFPN